MKYQIHTLKNGLRIVLAHTLSPADLGKFVVDETEKWGKVVRAAGIKAE
jgi:hypothetical protein